MGTQTLVTSNIILVSLALIVGLLILRFFYIRRKRYKKRIQGGEKQQKN